MRERNRLRRELADCKDYSPHSFSQLTSNYYLMRAALRYYKEKTGKSVTSTRISGNFPIAVSVAGSALSALEQIGVIEDRNSSGSSRYMGKDIDLDEMDEIGDILREEKELEPHH